MTLTVKDLTKREAEELEFARAWAQQQQDALDEVGPVIQKFAEHKDKSKLSAQDHRIIARHLRWGDEDYEAFLDPPVEFDAEGLKLEPLSIEARVERFLRTPQVHFYVDRGDKRYVVIVRQGEPTKILADDHPDYLSV